MDIPLTCSQINKKLNGSVEDRVQIAEMNDIPEDCACDVFNRLSQDENRLVRFNLSKNTQLPDSCSCEIFGRLSNDKDSGVRTFTKINDKFRMHCGGLPEIKNKKWHGFDVERQEINCKQKCNIDVLKGRLSVKDTDEDVISVVETRKETKEFLESEGFIEKPAFVSWYRNLSSLDNYTKEVKKGRDIRRGLNSLEEGKRNADIEFVFDKGLENEDYYHQWYQIYKKSMEKRERGRVVLKESEYPKRFTALYAVKDGKVIGGRMMNEKTNYNSIAYSAFKRDHKYLDEIAYAKIVDYTLNQNKKRLHLGIDTNFYGYHMPPGIYKSKTLFGFQPTGYVPKGREHFLVRKDDKFGDLYMFLSTDRREMPQLKNNIFVKGDKKVKKEDYPAPHGVEITNL